MRVLLIGATGATGREVLRSLAGHEVTALVRSARELHGATPVVGDARSRVELERAVIGQDAVISALGSKKVGPDDLQTAFLTAIAGAMTAQGVRRFISMTPWGVGGSRASAPLPLRAARATFLRNQAADRERGEAVLESSALDYTHVRCGLLGGGPARGGVRATADGRGIGWRIRRTDVAAFLVSQLEDTTWSRTEAIIGYPR